MVPKGILLAQERSERLWMAPQQCGLLMISEESQAVKVWRPLLMGEYPPPGPTKLGGKLTDKVRPILVYAEEPQR